MAEDKIPSLRDFFTVVFKHKWSIFLLFSVIVSTVTVLTYMYPFTYEASSKVLVKFKREAVPLTGGSPAPNTTLTMRKTEEEINSEIEILNNAYLIEKTVKLLWDDLTRTSEEVPTSIFGYVKLFLKKALSKIADLVSEIGYRAGLFTRMGPFESQMSRVLKNLKVEAIKDSDIILIKFRSPNPDLCAKVVNTMTDLYLAHHIQVHKIPRAEDFFTEQEEFLRTKLKEQEAALRSFKQQWNISAIAYEKQLLLENLSKMTFENQNIQSTINEIQGKIDELERAIIKRTNYKRMEDINPATLLNNPVDSELEKSILASQSQLEGLKAKQKLQGKQMEYYQSRLGTLDQKEIELNRLQRDLSALEEDYKRYHSRLEDARISAALDLEHISNVSVIEPAVTPFAPVRRFSFIPTRVLYISMGVVMGAILALAYAFLAEQFEHTFESREDIEKFLKVSCLACIPKE